MPSRIFEGSSGNIQPLLVAPGEPPLQAVRIPTKSAADCARRRPRVPIETGQAQFVNQASVSFTTWTAACRGCPYWNENAKARDRVCPACRYALADWL